MFKRKTVFVLGAGASAELGLPIGTGLAQTISERLNILYDDRGDHIVTGDRELFNQVADNERGHEIELQQACSLIRDGILLSNSIDEFLDIHKDNPLAILMGKAAIVRSILEAEKNSRLHFRHERPTDKMPVHNLINTWHLKFMRMLQRETAMSALGSIFENVAFIVFNYDRCLEFFLLNALQSLYAIDERTAVELLSKLTIIHPYGTVSPLPQFDPQIGAPFGSERANYHFLAQQIKTFSESLEEGDVVELIHRTISEAQRLVFLGFAFHAPNMKMLKLNKPTAVRKELYATVLGMSDSDATVTQIQLGGLCLDETGNGMIPAIALARGECTNLFDLYSKTLPN